MATYNLIDIYLILSISEMADAATEVLSIVLPKEYPLILLSCCILCIECFLMGMIAVAPARFSIFNSDYLVRFEKEHE